MFQREFEILLKIILLTRINDLPHKKDNIILPSIYERFPDTVSNAWIMVVCCFADK